MINLLQRVSLARVYINSKIQAEIKQGILLFIGFEKKDGELDFKSIQLIIDKIINFRIFSDESDKMNLSVKDIEGEILVVSQFTLAAETHKGLRPGFSTALSPELALPLYDKIVTEFKNKFSRVQTGIFGADMQIELINNGPVTFMISA